MMNFDYIYKRVETLIEERDALLTLLQVELPCTYGASHIKRLLESKLQDIESALDYWIDEAPFEKELLLEEDDDDDDFIFVEDEPEVELDEPLTEEELDEYFK